MQKTDQSLLQKKVTKTVAIHGPREIKGEARYSGGVSNARSASRNHQESLRHSKNYCKI